MEELKKLLETILNKELLQMILSGRRSDCPYQKIKVRPLLQKGELVFQSSAWDGKKEFHKNCGKDEIISKVLVWMSRDFKQMQADTTELSASVLVSKKGKVTIRTKKCADKRPAPVLAHNRTKRYVLEEGHAVPFLVKLGVMTPEGKVVAAKYDKFRQINRFLEFIEDICPVLPRGRELTMIDFGCGKSYLTFAMYYYLHELRGYEINIIGLDLKEDVIAHCNELAQEFGYEKLHFQTGDIAEYEGVQQVDLVVTLHACDTATDYALAKAVGWNAAAILSVPCCQHELNGQIQNELLEPVLKYGLLKERMAALITDGMRASLLEEAGYQVQVLEFIDMEHTPKNILIRAVRTKQTDSSDGRTEEGQNHSEKLKRLMEFLQVSPTLEKLLH
ncbi:MAG: SAM-dependent methyltransferase [Lachnospiraceae bacterium]|nr:SAM-dependent methyltransferase [Lachnospiraceae bacterium]